MKVEWQTKALGDLCSFINGDRGKNYPSRAVQTASGIPFINAGHLTDFGIDLQNVNYISKDQFDRLGSGKIVPNDILFCLRGSLGKFASVGNLSKGAIASSLVIVRPNSGVINKYIEAYFQSDLCREMIAKYANGAAQPNLSANSLSKFLIPVPPAPEQQRIVGILDEAFDAIATAKANAEMNLQNARALFEVGTQAAFAKHESKLVCLTEISDEITDGDHMPPPKADHGIPFITISDIRKKDRTLDFSDTFMVPETYFENLKPNKKPLIGDILYTVTGATLGIPVLVRETAKFCFQRHIALIRPKRGIDSRWLNYSLLSPQVFRQATEGSTGAAQKTVSLKILRNILVPQIAKSDQMAIADNLEHIEREAHHLESIYQKKCEALDELKNSLLHQAFSGKL